MHMVRVPLVTSLMTLLVCILFYSDNSFPHAVDVPFNAPPNPLNDTSSSFFSTPDETNTALELVKMFHGMFAGKIREAPKLMVIMGPPGSGKTNILEKVLKAHMAHIDNYAEIIVDHMLQRMNSYTSQMKELQRQRNELTEDEFLTKSQVIYQKYRPVVKYFSTMLLEVAFMQQLNIVYETTGTNLTAVMNVIQQAHENRYSVHIVFPYVTEHNLEERVKQRNAKIGRAIPLEMVLAMVHESQENFISLLPFADNAFLYDNNGLPSAELTPLFSKTAYTPHWVDLEEAFGAESAAEACAGAACDERSMVPLVQMLPELPGPAFYCDNDVLNSYGLLDLLKEVCPRA